MSKEYLEIIDSATTQKLVLPPTFTYSPDESLIGTVYAPPSKCDLRFKVGKFTIVQKKFQMSEEEKQLPKNWNNFTIDTSDSNKEKELKKKSIRPVNQGHCGSCFAVSIATTISDNFLFGMNLDENPSISPMYILSCLKDEEVLGQSVPTNFLKNNACNGGNPSGVIDFIIEKGISTNCCQNYYKICEQNKYCNPKSGNVDQEMQSVNDMIPKCGCCNTNPPKLYNIKNKIISYDPNHIKVHLRKYGAVVGGFIVYPNFMFDNSHGKFELTKGVYIKTANYAKGTQHENDTIPLGGHAISIVGWGVEHDISIEINSTTYTYPTVEYWVCRNSWSEKWGDGGYFKYALSATFKDLPSINEGCAFETDNSDYGVSLGGILLVEPKSIQDDTGLTLVDCHADYACTKPKLKEPTFISTITQSNIKYLAYICLFGIAVICLKHIFHEKKKRH